MSEKTLLIVERLLAAYCREDGPDLKATGEIVAADHVFVPAGEESEVEGRRDFTDWLRNINEMMPMRTEASGAVDFGAGKAIGVVNTHFRSATSGLESVQRMWFVFTVKDDRVVRSEAYTDPNAALDAAKAY